MTVIIRDAHLIERLQKQSEVRGHNTLTKTARELLIERLTVLEREIQPTARRRKVTS